MAAGILIEIRKTAGAETHVHNSGWVQSPHVDILKSPQRHDEMKGYIQGILNEYKNDRRVLMWDLYNEPANRNVRAYIKFAPDGIEDLALTLCKRVFSGLGRSIKSTFVNRCVAGGGTKKDLVL